MGGKKGRTISGLKNKKGVTDDEFFPES